MFQRILTLPTNHSLFLFGARGSGKSTLIQTQFPDAFLINLLNPATEERFQKHPEDLENVVKGLPDTVTHIVIDEVQKAPKLLDMVHYLIESTSKHFILTGSSARKIKRGSANFLAGRAFVYHLFPLSFLETQDAFNLEEALQYGQLPKVYSLNEKSKIAFLKAYATTYVKEEVWSEHLVRLLPPFRKFLEVAAQMNGKIINMAKIAQDVGIDSKTVAQYFLILEDTLLGFMLNGFATSVRKQVALKPKFYFFDTGVTRALAHNLLIPMQPSTFDYGYTFEHLVILECFKLSQYSQNDFKFSYLSTAHGAEIDLVIERPGQPTLFIEIKSKTQVLESDIRTLISLKKDLEHDEFVCFSQDPYHKVIEGIHIYPWQEGIRKFF